MGCGAKEAAVVVDLKQTVTLGFDCPACGKHRFSYVPESHDGRRWGPWYCDACGAGWCGTGTDMVEAARSRRVATYVLLKDPARDLYLVVRSGRTDPKWDDEEREQDRYFFEEHTCPTNFLGVDAAVLIENGWPDPDPHGVFKYVATVRADSIPVEEFNTGMTGHPDWMAVFGIKTKESEG